jgi:hypothetical protein
MRRATSKVVARAIDAGRASGAASDFTREASGRRIAAEAPSAVFVAARARRAGRMGGRGRDWRGRAPAAGEW